MSAIDEFNKYRVPEAKARLLSLDERSFRIEFTGSFCRTCGFYDYFDDLRVILEEVGLDASVKKIEEIDEGANVEFVIR